jgi:energy-coupling factor transporter ATP-binding protein EcfA2
MAAHRASELVTSPDALVGRERELRRLRQAVEKRESLLIHGPHGAGKTRIVQSLIESLPFEQRRACIYVPSYESVKDLARQIAIEFYDAGDPILRKKLEPRGAGSEDFRRVMRRLSSGQLKALIYEAAPRRTYFLFLDNFVPASRALGRFVRELIWRCRTPVYPIARGCTREEIGSAWSVYFTPEYQLSIGALTQAAAHEVLERNIRRWRLKAANLDDLRREAIRMAAGLPGTVERVCELAANSRYRSGEEIKLKLLHLDWLMRSGTQTRESGAA